MDCLTSALARLLDENRPRAGSFAITLFGDCISQQGGSVWLGSLVELMAEFGLNARQVRTAIFRLSRDGWLLGEQRGRRSFYRLSESGERQQRRAARRIYAATPAAWNGEWTLVMPTRVDGPQRDELRKRLAWQGFGLLPNGVLAHPRTDGAALTDTIEELGVASDVVVWQARPEEDKKLVQLVHDAWRLDELSARFRAFMTLFGPYRSLVLQAPRIDDRDAFVLRSLLVHEYRRVVLRAADLPPVLLPSDWPGHSAMALVGDVYRLLQAGASRYACAALANAAGPLPSPSSDFYSRFNGLEPVSARMRRKLVAALK